jgi:hypothetical protein
MKTKLVLITDTDQIECITELGIVPQMHEWFNLQDILKPVELEKIKQTANCWSGLQGTIEFVEFKQDNNDFYPEIHVLCED